MKKDSLLGKKVDGPQRRAPEILFPIERPKSTVPIFGFDVWRAYELAWSNTKGKPSCAILEIIYPRESVCIVESKSLKLYLNGLCFERFEDENHLIETIHKDLSGILQSPWLKVRAYKLDDTKMNTRKSSIAGFCIDDMDVEITRYTPDKSLLETGTQKLTKKRLISNLLRSNCPITRQPDWGTVNILYSGQYINEASLLRYICSYRDHEGFHEQCCESIFTDIREVCLPERLLVGCWYTRRGGIDINPVRSSYPIMPGDIMVPRMIRQ